MTLWWVGNLVFLAIVIPVVLVLLHRLMQPVAQIGHEADKILGGGATIVAQLDLVKNLVPTQASIQQIAVGVGHYGAALDNIL